MVAVANAVTAQKYPSCDPFWLSKVMLKKKKKKNLTTLTFDNYKYRMKNKLLSLIMHLRFCPFIKPVLCHHYQKD